MSGGWLPPSDAGDRYVPPAETPVPPVAGGPAAPPPGYLAYGPGPAVVTAAYGDRVQAAVVDTGIRLLIIVAFGAVGAIAYVAGTEAGGVGLVLGILVGFVASIAYAPVWIARHEGQTIGHRRAGTRIVRHDGRPVDGGGAFVREVLVKALLFEGIGGLAFSIPTLLNYLWPLWDPQDEALHDKLCSTRVVPA